MLDQISRTEGADTAVQPAGNASFQPIPWRVQAPIRYRNTEPFDAVLLFERITGQRMSLMHQLDGSVGLYQSADRAPRWLEAYLLQNQRAVADAISEERGRLVVRPDRKLADVVMCLRSPWDNRIEKALVHARAPARGRSPKQRPSLLTLWRHYLFLKDWFCSQFDSEPHEWRFGRVRRQIKQLGAAIAKAKASTPAEIKIKVEFLQLRTGALAPDAEVNAAVRTASRALNRLSAATKPAIRQEMRHAA